MNNKSLIVLSIALSFGLSNKITTTESIKPQNISIFYDDKRYNVDGNVAKEIIVIPKKDGIPSRNLWDILNELDMNYEKAMELTENYYWPHVAGKPEYDKDGAIHDALTQKLITFRILSSDGSLY